MGEVAAAVGLMVQNYTSRSSSQSEPRHVTQFQELEERFDTKKITLEKYVQGMSTHTNYCYCRFIYLIVQLYSVFLRGGETPLFGPK